MKIHPMDVEILNRISENFYLLLALQEDNVTKAPGVNPLWTRKVSAKFNVFSSFVLTVACTPLGMGSMGSCRTWSFTLIWHYLAFVLL